MRIQTKLVLVLIVAVPFAGLLSGGCSSSGASGTTDGGAGTGAAGTGSAGTGAAGTGAAGTGAAGTGAAGTGAAGTGAAGTGAAGTTNATDGGTDAVDGSTATDVATDKATTEAGTDTASTETGGTDTASTDGGLACTSITLPAAVFAHYLTAAAPAATGGDITEGTYSLTELNHYGSATASTSNDPIRSALKLTGTTIEWASQAKTDAATSSSYTYVKATNKLMLTNVCPVAGPGNGTSYTSTTTTFKLYLDAEYVFTKQ